MRAWWTWIQAFAALATVISAVLVPAAFVANAAGGTLYLDQATDPHGEIWLPKTVDGTTTGALSTVATDGHLWATDVPSGFCRVDSVVDPATGAVTNQYARKITGGCIHAGQKDSQVQLDPRRNADGTFYVYTCDWAVFSQGCYRLTYDPGAQLMTAQELLAAGRFPQSKKPFATVLGQDGNLYVSSDITPYIYKFTTPNTPNVGDMTTSIVAVGNAQQRARAITPTCWDSLRGGLTGLPTCAQSAAAGKAAPDLIMDQKTAVTVILDYENCVGVPIDPATAGPANGATPSCVANSTPVRVLTAMGAWTQGAWDRPVTAIPAAGTVTQTMPAWGPNFNPDVIYISNSTGAVSEIVRYTISKNTQDSYSNFATFPDGTSRQYSFAFSPVQAPDGTMYIGDDPCAGAQAFCGALWKVAPNAPADVVGAPGAPASPPPPAAQKVGTLVGSGVSLPNDGLWLPLYSDAAGTTVALNPDGSATGHLWLSDNLAGFCRMDPNPTPGAGNPPTAAGAPFFENGATCETSAKKPGQPVLDPTPRADGTHFLYLPDDSTRGEGLFRLIYDWKGNFCPGATPGTFKGPESVCPDTSNGGPNVAAGQGLAGQRASAAAMDPTTGTIYVGFRNRNLTAITQIARVANPSGAAATVDFISRTARQKPVFTLAFIGADMYVGSGGGLDFLPRPSSCPTDGCISVQVLNVRAPRGMVTDGVDKIYMAGPSIPVGCPPTCPAPGTNNTNVSVFSPSTGNVDFFSSQGAFLDGSLGPYDVVDSLTLDPQGNLFVADDPSVLGLPAQQGRVWKVPFTGQEPLPAIQSKPHDPTNNVNPSFQFASADLAAKFQCSLVPFGAADSFSNCTSPVTYGTNAGSATPVQQTASSGLGPLADGAYTFKVKATGAAGTSFAAGYGFTIDTVAPVVTINSAPTSPSNDNTPSFSFSANKLGTLFQCSLSTGLDAFQFCNSPLTYPAQPDGSYTFKVQGTDAAGNVTTVSKALVIDTVAPTVTASPAGGAFTAPQSVVLTASEPATIFYTTDGTTPTATSTSGPSPVTINVASSATLQYFAKDAAGNAGAVASQKYQIGNVTITGNPTTLTNRNTPTFTFTDTKPGATFTCSLVLQTAADSFSPCSSPKTYAAQPDGAYRFVAKDNAGSTAQFLFTIDTTPPVVTFTSNPANPLQSTTANFGFTSNEAGTTFQCSFGPQAAPDAFAACTSPVTESNLADGSYVFKVKGTDLAGNTSAPNAYFFNVSAVLAQPTVTAPVASLTGLTTATTGTTAVTTSAGPITASTNQVPVTISWTGTGCQSGATNCNIDHYVLEQQINGAGFGAPITLPAANATSVTLNLKPSPSNQPSAATNYQFKVQAVDKQGHVSTFAVSPSFQVPDTDNSFNSSFNGTWSGVNISSAFGGSVQESATANSTAQPSNAAPATSLALVSTVGPDRGKAQIKIDGQIVATVDLYAPTQATAQLVWSINGLAPGVNHNIQIVATGTKNTAASAAKVDYDAILAVH